MRLHGCLKLNHTLIFVLFFAVTTQAQDFVFIDNASIDDNVNVFNVVGKRVMSFKIETENQQVDIKELKSGIYFLRLNNGQATKLLKK